MGSEPKALLLLVLMKSLSVSLLSSVLHLSISSSTPSCLSLAALFPLAVIAGAHEWNNTNDVCVCVCVCLNLCV